MEALERARISHPVGLSNFTFSVEDIKQIVGGAKVSAPGPDGLPISVIKHYVEVLAPKMSEVIGPFLRDPQMAMKIGRAILLPKTRPPSSDFYAIQTSYHLSDYYPSSTYSI